MRGLSLLLQLLGERTDSLLPQGREEKKWGATTEGYGGETTANGAAIGLLR